MKFGLLSSTLVSCFAFAVLAITGQAQTNSGTVWGPIRVGPAATRFVAPGLVAEFAVAGLSTADGMGASATSVPLPLSLDGITATVEAGLHSYSAPLFGVGNTTDCGQSFYPDAVCAPVLNVMVEIPSEIDGDILPLPGPTSPCEITFHDSFGHSASQLVYAISDSIQLISATHADGSVVEGNVSSGETIVLYAFGLGTTMPRVASGQAGSAPRPGIGIAATFAANVGAVQPSPLWFEAVPGPDYPAPMYAGLVSGNVGLYQINIQIPAPAVPPAPCDSFAVGSNLTITVVGQSSADSLRFCVAQ